LPECRWKSGFSMPLTHAKFKTEEKCACLTEDEREIERIRE